MCLIIASPSGQATPKEHLENTYNAGNNDGWGISYWTGAKVLVLKGFDLLKLVAAAKKVVGLPHVIHLRWGTHGERSYDNCHPFKIRRDLYMAHNGILPLQPPKEDKRSDTAMLASMLKSFSPDVLLKADNLEALGKMVGSGNKLTFQFRNEIHIVNEKMGEWYGDRWYSNDYYHLNDGHVSSHGQGSYCYNEWEKWLMEEGNTSEQNNDSRSYHRRNRAGR